MFLFLCLLHISMFTFISIMFTSYLYEYFYLYHVYFLFLCLLYISIMFTFYFYVHSISLCLLYISILFPYFFHLYQQHNRHVDPNFLFSFCDVFPVVCLSYWLFICLYVCISSPYFSACVSSCQYILLYVYVSLLFVLFSQVLIVFENAKQGRGRRRS